jgi:hypothetical protein
MTELSDFFNLVSEEEKNKKIMLEKQLEKAKAEDAIVEAFGKDATWDETKPNSFDYAEQYYTETFTN